MPFYEYFCNGCKNPFKTFHKVDEAAESCPKCESVDVKKTLPLVTLTTKTDNKATAGDRVEKFIEESREKLKEQVQESRKELKI
jgi:putative FmdB family regulatory protein